MYTNFANLEGFYYQNKDSNAIIKDGVMRIVGPIAYEKLMYCACYRQNGLVCAYCGQPLSKESKTVDHKIPKVYGGVSILENMVPACQKCNEQKSCLFPEEYRKVRTIEGKTEQKMYRSNCIKEHENEVIKRGLCIPVEWLEEEPQTILVNFKLVEEYKKSSKYMKIEEFFCKFGNVPKPVVISGNNRLLDGFNVLMFAKYKGLRNIPTIKLDNVIIN